MAGYFSFAQFYDELMDVDYHQILQFAQLCFKKEEKAFNTVLDLACGTGRLSKLFAESGFDVVGVDLSEDMLAVAQENGDGINPLFLNQDMCELDLNDTVDCCICTLDSLNHLLEKSDVQAVFGKVSLFLNDGGLFIFDVNTPYKHKEVLADNSFVYDTDDVFCAWQNETDEESLITDIQLDFFKLSGENKYERFEEYFAERAYDINDLKSWLERSNFEIAGIFGDYNFKKLQEDSQRAVFVARRKDRHG